jgi:hypothetical protein
MPPFGGGGGGGLDEPGGGGGGGLSLSQSFNKTFALDAICMFKTIMTIGLKHIAACWGIEYFELIYHFLLKLACAFERCDKSVNTVRIFKDSSPTNSSCRSPGDSAANAFSCHKSSAVMYFQLFDYYLVNLVQLPRYFGHGSI